MAAATRLVFLLGLFIGSASSATPANIGNGRLTEQASGSQVVFDLDRPTRYTYFHLDNPPRLVLDLDDARLDAPLPPLSSADLVRVRAAAREQGRKLRVVFELRRRSDYKITLLAHNGYRLVADFFRTPAASAPAAAPIRLTSASAPARRDAHAARPKALTKPIRLASRAARPAAPVAGPAPATRPAPAPVAESVPAPPARPLTVAIDAGHGGRDPGAIGPNGTYEKDIVLQIAKRFKRLLDGEPELRGCMVRDQDVYLRLHNRVRIARDRCKADLFVSIHADAYGDSSSGASVFVLSNKGASSALARFLADSANHGGGLDERFDVGDDKDLQRILLDMVHDAVRQESRELAGSVLTQLGKIGKLHGSRTVEHAPFSVLKAPDIPSILVETAFISNPNEERKLRSKDYQHKLAGALLAGVRGYLAKRPELLTGRGADIASR